MTICESCIRNKDCKWNKGNPRHCTLYTDKEETNFVRITESPDALAEWLGKHINFCDDFFAKIALTITKLMVVVCDILKRKNGLNG